MFVTWFQVLNFALCVCLILIGYKYFETFWSYKINKPYAWDQAVALKTVTPQLIKMERTFRDRVRFYNLWFQIEYLKRMKITGAFAELGVHKGVTAKAIHWMDVDRKLYLFDTFNGFDPRDLTVEVQQEDKFDPSNSSDTDVEIVRAYIGGNDNLIFKKGYFPETTLGLEYERFALVHLDADLYVPTLEALKFFYPKMNPGGVIIIHDYNHTWDGIPKAVNTFVENIPEPIIELMDWQGSVMIIRNKN
jgi:O-methyltransferase